MKQTNNGKIRGSFCYYPNQWWILSSISRPGKVNGILGIWGRWVSGQLTWKKCDRTRKEISGVMIYGELQKVMPNSLKTGKLMVLYQTILLRKNSEINRNSRGRYCVIHWDRILRIKKIKTIEKWHDFLILVRILAASFSGGEHFICVSMFKRTSFWLWGLFKDLY